MTVVAHRSRPRSPEGEGGEDGMQVSVVTIAVRLDPKRKRISRRITVQERIVARLEGGPVLSGRPHPTRQAEHSANGNRTGA